MLELEAVQIMHAFLEALAESDFGRARSCLADHDFRYISPLSTFNDASAFIGDLSRIGAIMEKVEVRRTFVDGAEVCVIANVKTSMSGLRSTPIVLWATIIGGRIATMQTFFDAREYAAMFETH